MIETTFHYTKKELEWFIKIYVQGSASIDMLVVHLAQDALKLHEALNNPDVSKR